MAHALIAPRAGPSSQARLPDETLRAAAAAAARGHADVVDSRGRRRGARGGGRSVRRSRCRSRTSVWYASKVRHLGDLLEFRELSRYSLNGVGEAIAQPRRDDGPGSARRHHGRANPLRRRGIGQRRRPHGARRSALPSVAAAVPGSRLLLLIAVPTNRQWRRAPLETYPHAGHDRRATRSTDCRRWRLVMGRDRRSSESSAAPSPRVPMARAGRRVPIGGERTGCRPG